MSFEGSRDWICGISALLLVVFAVVSYIGLDIPAYVLLVISAVFIIGGLFGLFDAFSVDNVPMKIGYMLLFIIVVIMGINGFFTIPVISEVLTFLPIDITHFIINAVVSILLIIVAFQSGY